MNNQNNTTERRPRAIFTKWDYATGEQLDRHEIFMDEHSFVESLRSLWPDEYAIRWNAEKKAYEGVFKVQDNPAAPFAYRFELAIL